MNYYFFHNIWYSLSRQVLLFFFSLLTK